MTKRELVAAITDLNPTAQPAFLAKFQEQDLAQYLEHLAWVAQGAAPQRMAVDAPPPTDDSPACIQDELPAASTAAAVECEPAMQMSAPAAQGVVAESEYQPAETSAEAEDQSQPSAVATMEPDAAAPDIESYAASQGQADSDTCLF
jgi:hypothetical protein